MFTAPGPGRPMPRAADCPPCRRTDLMVSFSRPTFSFELAAILGGEVSRCHPRRALWRLGDGGIYADVHLDHEPRPAARQQCPRPDALPGGSGVRWDEIFGLSRAQDIDWATSMSRSATARGWVIGAEWLASNSRTCQSGPLRIRASSCRSMALSGS